VSVCFLTPDSPADTDDDDDDEEDDDDNISVAMAPGCVNLQSAHKTS